MELSNVEKEFVLRALRSGRRVDGRGLLDRRRVGAGRSITAMPNGDRLAVYSVCHSHSHLCSLQTSRVTRPWQVKFSFDRNAERTSAEVCLGRTR